MDIVYFDLETQRTLNDVEGRKSEMRMSVGVVYSTAEQAYTIYAEEDAGALIDRLRRADLVVGYNILDFDFEVLLGYSGLDLSYSVRALDLLADIERAVGRRLSLESIARATLGLGKTADGLDAIRWFREGRLVDIARYCCFDVKVTRLIHEHGARTGRVACVNREGEHMDIPVPWKMESPA